jgi:hypothetical protein
MNAVANRQLLLRRRPSGLVSDEDFELREAPAPRAGPGEVVVRTLYLSFDPTQRGWLNDAPGYMPPVQIGEPMRAGAIGQVVDSQRADFAAGDLVQGLMSWQDYVLVGGKAAEGLSRVRGRFPLTWHLGVLGMTGMTAYFGMLDVGKVRAGDTVAVSGAAGATGSVAGQIAKIAGCRVIGIAGGPEKCRWLTETAGFDAAIDYKSEKVRARLAALAPRGIDVFFDNVGGAILDAALLNLAQRARVVICGGISSGYGTEMPPGPKHYMQLVFKSARMEGFLILTYRERFGEALARLGRWVEEGRIRFEEDVIDGLENAPRTLRRLFEGANFGKQILKVADPPLPVRAAEDS